jgi:hypothetical protein
MYFSYIIACYACITNDSIQTIGTFLASTRHVSWWIIWLYFGLTCVATIAYSYFMYNGDISFERLSSKGYDQDPTSYSYTQACAPLILMTLTRLRIPASTSLLLLALFSSKTSAFLSVVQKSMTG